MPALVPPSGLIIPCQLFPVADATGKDVSASGLAIATPRAAVGGDRVIPESGAWSLNERVSCHGHSFSLRQTPSSGWGWRPVACDR